MGKSVKCVLASFTAFLFFIFSLSPAPAFNVAVANGAASIAQSGNTTTITTTGKAVLQGNTSIAANQIVRIVGPNDVLLRDTTGLQTNWLGTLLAQGNVVLINANGIYIANSANINVQSLIASTLNIQDEAFLTGQLNFQKINEINTAQILNEANITVKNGGYVVFIADRVENGGTITAYMGSVAFGSGENITVSFDQGGLVNLVVNQGLAQQLTGADGQTLAQIVNQGTIEADGGRVQMTARLLETTLKSVTNNEGIIEADQIVNQNGVVELAADGGIDNSGTISASRLNESGYTFKSTGTLDVGHAYFNNLDGAIDISGNVSGTISDVANIDFTGAVTLTGDTTLQADSGGTNSGEIVMNGNSLTGGDFNLTLDASYSADSHMDTLDGPITGVNLLTLNSSSGVPETFISTGASFSVNTLQTNNNSLFSRVQGVGSFADPFMIYSDSKVQGGLEYIPTFSLISYYELANNINAADTSASNAGAGFIPIGTSAAPFAGYFNGNNMVIDSLTINRPGTDNVGLFGYTSGATISDVGLTNMNITGQNNVGGLVGNSQFSSITNSYAGGSVIGSANDAGGLVGNNQSTIITNSYAGGTVTGNNQVGGLAGDNLNTAIITDSYASGNAAGNSQVGGLVGDNSASITDTYATGNVTGSGSDIGGLIGNNTHTINNTYATGNVMGNSQVGGLVGNNDGTAINNSYASGDVTGSGSDTGGLVGENLNSSTIANSFASGTVSGNSQAGGLVGENTGSSSISNSFASGDVTESGSDAGGLVGENQSSTISNSFASGTVTGNTNAGGLVGDNLSNSTIINSFATGVAASVGDSNATAGGLIGNDDGTNTLTNNWWFNASNSNGVANNSLAAGVSKAGAVTDFYGTGAGTGGAVYSAWDLDGLWISNITNYPHLVWKDMGDGSGFIGGTSLHPFQISNVNQLQFMGYYLFGFFTVENNIDASATSGWNAGAGFTPVGNSTTAFTGNLNGNNMVIDSLFINRPSTDNAGLFGYTNDAVIFDIGLTNMNITGQNNVGGLVGNNQTSNISNSFTSGSVTGSGNDVGGMMGNDKSSQILASFALGTVTDSGSDTGGLSGDDQLSTITDSYADETVSGNSDTGGLIGNNGSTITDTYATGNVTGSGSDIGGLIGNNTGTINNSYASGIVMGNSQVGGLVGINNGSTLTNTYAAGNVTGSGSDTGGLVGENLNSSTIANSFASGTVSGNSQAGGLVGENTSNSSISNSFASGDVTASGSDAGGLVGENQTSTISNSFASGTVTGNTNAGGLVGNNSTNSTIIDSFATGVAASVGDSNATAGGLIGNDDGTNTLTNNWWFNASNTKGVANNGSAAGVSKAGAVTDFYGTGAGTGGAVYSAWDLDGLWISNISNYPHLVWKDMGDGNNFIGGTSLHPFQISNVNQLQFMGYYLFGFFTVENNIDASATSGWNAGAGFTPVGNNTTAFTGNFNGNNMVIDSLFINRPGTDDVGLFGETNGNNFIDDIGLTNMNITGQNNVGGLIGLNQINNPIFNSFASGAVSGNSQVGGLVGDSQTSSITNSYAAGTVTGSGSDTGGLVGYSFSSISNSYSSVNVTGNTDVGGLVGYDFSSIINSASIGNVTGSGSNVGGLVGYNLFSTLVDSYASGNVTGNSSTGGLVGYAQSANISNSFSWGNVTGSGDDTGGLVGFSQSSTISDSYANGTVSGTDHVGGLAGSSNSSFITGSYANGDVTGSGNDTGGLVGNNQSSTITNSYATGTVTGSGNDAGGLAGNNQSSMITNSYATGGVSGNTDAGGLAGNNSSSSTVSNSYATGPAASTGDANATAGGLIGNDDGSNTLTNNWWFNAGNTNGVANNGLAAGVSEAGAVTDFYGTGSGTGGAVYVPLHGMWDFTAIPIWDSFAGTYPHLHWEHFTPGVFLYGNSYADFGITGLDEGIDVNLIDNGTAVGTTETLIGGAFEFPGLSLSANDALLLYLSGGTVTGNTVTAALNSTNNIRLDIYGGGLILRNESGNPVTNSILNTAVGSSSNAGILYSVSGGDLTVNSGIALIDWINQTFTPGGNVTLQGDGSGLIIQSGATLQAGPDTITVPGDFTNSGTFIDGTSTVIFDQSSGTQTLDTGNSNFYNITHSGSATLQLETDNLVLDNAFTDSSGTFDPDGLTTTVTGLTTLSGGLYQAGTGTQAFNGGLTISGGTFTGSTGNVTTADLTLSNGILTAPSGTFDVSGNWDVTGGNFTPGPNTVTFNGSGTQTLNSSNQSFYNLINSGTGTVELNGTGLAVTGAFTNSGGIFNANGLANTVTGPTTLSGGEYQAGGGAQAFNGGLTISGAAFTASSGNISTTDITVSSGTFTGSTGAVGDSGGFTLSGGTFTAPSGTFDVAGNWLQSGGVFIPGGNTVTFDGSGLQTFDSGGSSFDNITHSGGGTLQLTSGLTLANGGYIFTNSAGTFDLNGNSWTMTGNNFSNNNGNLQLLGSETVTGLIMDTAHGTVTYNGGASYGDLDLGNAYNNLTFNNANGAWDLNSALSVNGTFNIAAGTLNNTGGPITITVGGDWSDTGAFNAGASSVVLDGVDQTISGTTSFDNLQKDSGGTLTFEAGDEQTVTGLLDLVGTSSSLKIRSTVTGTQAKLNLEGASILSHLDVEDSNGTGLLLVCLTGCNDSGDNTNWLISSVLQQEINPQIVLDENWSDNNRKRVTGWIYNYSLKLPEIYESDEPYVKDSSMNPIYANGLSDDLQAVSAIERPEGFDLAPEGEPIEP